jgi:hypothetical protein
VFDAYGLVKMPFGKIFAKLCGFQSYADGANGFTLRPASLNFYLLSYFKRLTNSRAVLLVASFANSVEYL